MEPHDYTPPAEPFSQPPYGLINSLMKKGKVVVFLGAGASVAGPEGRGPREPLASSGLDRLPSRDEVARHLSTEAGLVDAPRPDGQAAPPEEIDLALAAQFVEMEAGRGPVDDVLRDAYAGDRAPGELHAYLARFPANLLIVTTNYDELLERAFTTAGRPHALVTYQRERPSFLFQESPDAAPRSVLPNELALDFEGGTVIYKMHGTVSERDTGGGSYVITEDDYVNFLTRMGAKTAIPAALAAALQRSHLLFLGYGLRDWYSRVILHSLWRERPLRYRSWVIQPGPTQLEQRLYKRYGLDLYRVKVEEFVAGLRAELG